MFFFYFHKILALLHLIFIINIYKPLTLIPFLTNDEKGYCIYWMSTQFSNLLTLWRLGCGFKHHKKIVLMRCRTLKQLSFNVIKKYLYSSLVFPMTRKRKGRLQDVSRRFSTQNNLSKTVVGLFDYNHESAKKLINTEVADLYGLNMVFLVSVTKALYWWQFEEYI